MDAWFVAEHFFKQRIYYFAGCFVRRDCDGWRYAQITVGMERIYQDSNLITQSELKGMMNDNSEDGKIQDWYLHSYIPTVSVHGPRHV